MAGGQAETLAPLTRREGEVLELVSRGLTNGEIATRLEVTTHAVKFHLASIYRKLRVANRTEAAAAYFYSSPRLARPADGTLATS